MLPSGPLFKRIQQAILDTITYADLRQALWYGLNQNLDLLVPQKTTYPDQLFDLLQGAARRGELLPLLACLAGERPSLQPLADEVGALPAAALTAEAWAVAPAPPAHLPDDSERVNPADLRRAYLNYVLNQADQLPLSGVDRKMLSSADAQLQLSAVYTALLTQTTEAQDADVRRAGERGANAAGDKEGPERQRRLSAVEQLDRHAHLVLQGGPGSGKSTFVSFVALCHTGALLNESQLNLQLLTEPLPATEKAAADEEKPSRQPWAHGPLLPVRVVLRDFAARGLPPAGQSATVEHLWRFVEDELRTAGLAEYAPHLRKQLLKEGGLLLLDGLDEVPEADERRAQIKQVVTAFAAAHRHCRILVTSRTYAYQNQDWRLPGFAEAVLEPFSRQQIGVFIERWYAHTATVRHRNPEDMQGRAELLKQRVFANERLYALAEQPLLLTLMASLHAWRGGSLPERRVELYANAVDLLLDWWENQRVVRNARGENVVIQPSLEEFLKLKDRLQLMNELYRLSFAAHERQPQLTGTADIAQGELVDALLKISGVEVRPKLLIDYLSNRAGLLAPRGNGVYTLPHRTFQEYLAACYLTGDDFPNRLADLARGEPERWREVVLLAGAKAATGSTSTVWSLVDALCYLSPTDAAYAPADHWGALLAGQALVEIADVVNVHKHNQLKLERVRQGLLHAMRGAVLPALDRTLAGQVLAKLGEPRIEVMDPLRMQFCLVPAGPFVMGSKDDPQAWEDEKPENERYDISYDYWIGRYPVTVAQYGQFVAVGGYDEANYWKEAQQAGLWKQGKFIDRDRPYLFGEPFDLRNHPVLGVSWYEALAFVRWLNEMIGLPPGSLRLPNEPEWEKAGRGGLGVLAQPVMAQLQEIAGCRSTAALLPNEKPRRRYPWADEPDAECANYDDTKIGGSSAVGCFSRGASPYGVEELSGNVWEWTRSVWADYPYPVGGTELAEREDLAAGDRARRVLRGGAFHLDVNDVRCAARNWYNPSFVSWYLGLRVVLSPFTSGL